MTTYKVTGGTPFMEHEPGEEFDAELDPDQEARAVARGSIEAIKAGTKTKKEENDG